MHAFILIHVLIQRGLKVNLSVTKQTTTLVTQKSKQENVENLYVLMASPLIAMMIIASIYFIKLIF